MSRSFDTWLRRNAPPVEENREARRLLYSRLEDRLHQRRQTRRRNLTGLSVILVVLLGTTVFDVNPLGSGNRDLVRRADRPEVMFDPLYPERGYIDEKGSDKEFWETIRDQSAAGMRVLDNVEFWCIEGRYEWMVGYRHVVDGAVRSVTDRRPPEQIATMTNDDRRWWLQNCTRFYELIESGQARELPARQYEIFGQMLWFRVWQIDTERGPYIHGEAVIVPEAQSPGR